MWRSTTVVLPRTSSSFDRPVMIFGEPMRRFAHSAHNFELISSDAPSGRRESNTAAHVSNSDAGAAASADKYLKDAEEFYVAYKAQEGTCGFDEFKNLLRALFEHTLNSHVYGERAEASRKDDGGLWLHPSPDYAESAWAAETGQTLSEFRRLFEAVDSVHAYT